MSIIIEHTTKEGVLVKAGQVWRDLDKRCPDRLFEVVEVTFGKAIMRGCSARWFGAKTNVSIRRMHKHSAGWELVSELPRG